MAKEWHADWLGGDLSESERQNAAQGCTQGRCGGKAEEGGGAGVDRGGAEAACGHDRGPQPPHRAGKGCCLGAAGAFALVTVLACPPLVTVLAYPSSELFHHRLLAHPPPLHPAGGGGHEPAAPRSARAPQVQGP
eukprot:scaffold23821_cov60-Phaeocystis_antarctica.AAC.4